MSASVPRPKSDQIRRGVILDQVTIAARSLGRTAPRNDQTAYIALFFDDDENYLDRRSNGQEKGGRDRSNRSRKRNGPWGGGDPGRPRALGDPCPNGVLMK